MLRLVYVLSILVAVVLLNACSRVNPPFNCSANPYAKECYKPPCLDTPEGCRDPEIILETTLKQADKGEDYPIYLQGGKFDGDMSLTLYDPDNVVYEAVLFLNLVKCIAPKEPFCKTVEQIDIRTVFDQNSSSFDPDINKKLFQGSAVNDLRDGVKTVIDAKLVPSAPVGTYALALQVFNCDQTDPTKVNSECADKRIDRVRSYRFKIAK